MRNGAKRWRDSYCKYVDSGGGRDWPGGRERPTGNPVAAVHRHILDRINAINDCLKKKKKGEQVSDRFVNVQISSYIDMQIVS